MNFKGSFSKCDSILSKKFSLNLLNAFLTVENGHKIRNSQSECINSSIEQVEAEPTHSDGDRNALIEELRAERDAERRLAEDALRRAAGEDVEGDEITAENLFKK